MPDATTSRTSDDSSSADYARPIMHIPAAERNRWPVNRLRDAIEMAQADRRARHRCGIEPG
jgi:hypothetical protein